MVKNVPAMQELQEIQIHFPGQEEPVEEGIAAHSGTLAWRIPWTEEPGGLQSIGLQSVRHKRVTNVFTFFQVTFIRHFS